MRSSWLDAVLDNLTVVEEVLTTYQEPVRPARNEDYCEWSELRHEHCAHCLGHYIDPDLLEASKF